MKRFFAVVLINLSLALSLSAAAKTTSTVDPRITTLQARITSDLTGAKLTRVDANQIQRDLKQVQLIAKRANRAGGAIGSTQSLIGQKLNKLAATIDKKEDQAAAIKKAQADTKANQPPQITFASAKK
jgi:TolA-binding protein